MLVLGLEGGAGMVGVALAQDGSLLAEVNLRQPQSQSELVIPLVDEVLKLAGVRGEDLDALAVDIGPGTYTGIRVGIATAQGLAAAWQKPVAGVQSLAVLAAQACPGGGRACVLLPARNRTVTAALVTVTAWPQVAAACVWGPAMLAIDDFLPVLASFAGEPPLLVTGPGVDQHRELLMPRQDGRSGAFPGWVIAADRLPRAGMVAILGEASMRRGEGGEPWQVQPVYAKEYAPPHRNNVPESPSGHERAKKVP